eukprot:1913567-Rhodomonas_salina.1
MSWWQCWNGEAVGRCSGRTRERNALPEPPTESRLQWSCEKPYYRVSTTTNQARLFETVLLSQIDPT